MGELIDVSHLDEQTFGDADIRSEIIALFQQQSTVILAALEGGTGVARSETAHRLKGSALSIGAFPLADASGRLEEQPDDPGRLADVRRLLDETLRALRKLPGP